MSISERDIRTRLRSLDALLAEEIRDAGALDPEELHKTGDIYADWDIDQLAATMADVLAGNDEPPDAKIPGSRQKIPANEPKVETAGIEPASAIA
jgi:hypothetical protein